MKRLPFLALIAAVLLLAAACGDDSSSDDAAASDTTAATTTAATDSGPDYGGAGTTETTAAPAGGEATVALGDVGDAGQALVGPDGHTLYLFEMDDGTTSACTEACADVWPALVADGEATAGDGVDQSLLGTADGQVPDQVTYNGHLLYSFSGDEAPGDVNGLQIPEWYPVDAEGNAIDED
jgi:predicted lipoprotein with Yx(FWY)xxD motif